MTKREILLALSVIIPGAFLSHAEESLRSVDPNDGWKFATKSNDVTIYSRVRAGSPLKEFKAVGGIDAPSGAVHAVIDDFENYPGFMPYTVECRLIKRETDSIVGYQRLSPKICEDRDYTLRVWKKSWPAADGFVYLDRWTPANELGPPEKKGVVRVKACEGGWLLEPNGAIKRARPIPSTPILAARFQLSSSIAPAKSESENFLRRCASRSKIQNTPRVNCSRDR